MMTKIILNYILVGLFLFGCSNGKKLQQNEVPIFEIDTSKEDDSVEVAVDKDT
ncbi:MAG: hypothetical protein GWN62_14695, partial [Aliifodinibius sp.]|nr:hypothetical protein [Fodinibius sp.]